MKTLCLICLMVISIAGAAARGAQTGPLPARAAVTRGCQGAPCPGPARAAFESDFAAETERQETAWHENVGQSVAQSGDADPDWHFTVFGGAFNHVFDWLREHFFGGGRLAPDATWADQRLFDPPP